MKKIILASLLAFSLPQSQTSVQPIIQNYTYAIIISKSAYADAGWKAVADALVAKHTKAGAKIITYNSSPLETQSALSTMMPTYIAYVAKPVTESNAANISALSAMLRNLDSDPYTDAIWSVVTGYEAADALRAINDRLDVKTMLWASGGGNGPATHERLFQQGIGMDCDKYDQTAYSFPDGRVWDDQKGGHPEGSTDRMPLIAKWLNASSVKFDVPGYPSIQGPIDAIQTGGHGFERGWQAHYNEKGYEGMMTTTAGQIYAKPYSGQSIAINVPTPKVYMATTNCLVANPDNLDNMVYAWFHSGRAVNMYGFMPLASSGDDFMGWGTYNRYTKFNGYYNLPESFYYGQVGTTFQTKISQKYKYSDAQGNPFYAMTKQYANDGQGNNFYIGAEYFLDQAAIFGDPKADAYVYAASEQNHAYLEEMKMTPNLRGDSATFSYKVTLHGSDLDGSRWTFYQLRPMQFLPQRINPQSVQIISNNGLDAEIVDNFVMWEIVAPNGLVPKGSVKEMVFKAALIPGAPINHYQSGSVNSSSSSSSVSSSSSSNTTPILSQTDFAQSLIQLVHFSKDGIVLKAEGFYEIRLYNSLGQLIQTQNGLGMQNIPWNKPLGAGNWIVEVKDQSNSQQRWRFITH